MPFHTWLPDAAAASTPGTAVLLVGVLDKVGTFGMIKLCLPIFPAASAFYAPVIIVLCVVEPTARCWQLVRPTSSDLSPTPRSRTSVSSVSNLRDDNPGAVRFDVLHVEPRLRLALCS